MEDTNITFCGAGFLGIYHIGVVSCLKAHARKLLAKISKYGGCSAGALAACMLLCDIDMSECVHFVMNQASKVHRSTLGPLSRKFNIVDQIRKSSAKHLPANAYQLASGKLYISLTRVSDFQNVIVSQYDSNNDLIDALICTCFIPVFCGMIPPTFKGTAYIDGGLTDNLPQHFSGTTITVSPFGGENDICPDDRHKSSSQFDMKNTNIQFSCHNLYRMTRAMFPPNNDVLIRMCQEGFNDAFSYLYKTYGEYLTYDDSIRFSITSMLDEMAIMMGSFTQDQLDDPESSAAESEAAATVDDLSDNDSVSYYLSEAEQLLATGGVFQMLASPKELNDILWQTKELLDNEQLNWYFFEIFLTMTKWMTKKPLKYTATYCLNLSKQILCGLLPAIHGVGTKTNLTQQLMDLALKGFHAYKETAIFEWHPTIKVENQLRIKKSKQLLKSVSESLKTVPVQRTSSETDTPQILHQSTVLERESTVCSTSLWNHLDADGDLFDDNDSDDDRTNIDNSYEDTFYFKSSGNVQELRHQRLASWFSSPSFFTCENGVNENVSITGSICLNTEDDGGDRPDGYRKPVESQNKWNLYFKGYTVAAGCLRHLNEKLMSIDGNLMKYAEEGNKNDDAVDVVGDGFGSSVSSSVSAVVTDGMKDMVGQALGYVFSKSLGIK